MNNWSQVRFQPATIRFLAASSYGFARQRSCFHRDAEDFANLVAGLGNFRTIVLKAFQVGAFALPVFRCLVVRSSPAGAHAAL